MSKSKFLALVAEGKMPKGVKVGAMTLWDRHLLDSALEDLQENAVERDNPIEKHYGASGD